MQKTHSLCCSQHEGLPSLLVLFAGIKAQEINTAPGNCSHRHLLTETLYAAHTLGCRF